MKKKLTWIHSLILFFSMVVLLVTTALIISSVNKDNNEKSLKTYLSVTQEILSEELNEKDDTSSINKTGEILKNSNDALRLTILTKDGDVLYDSMRSNVSENHLTRPEIQDLGVIYYRYSDTLNVDMMYIAGFDTSNQYYIRVAMPLNNVNDIIWRTVIISSGVLLSILAISIVIDYFLIDKAIAPIQKETKRLAGIVGNNEVLPTANEIESISYQIDRTKELIQDKIDSLTEEKEKLDYIINTMQQGLIILSNEGDVLLINNEAQRYFNYKFKEGDLLENVTIIPEVREIFVASLKNDDQQKEIEIKDKILMIMAHHFKADWIKENSGVSLSIFDISYEKRLEKAKRDFFANASHELKSPLTSIIGYTQMIKNGFLSDEKERNDAMDRILFESKRINKIVIEMLELSRLEVETPDKDESECSLKQSINAQIDNLKEEQNEMNITINITGDDFKTTIIKDDLDTLIKNIIENAIKYNKKGGEIYISLSKEEKKLAISDTGIGIPKEAYERVFERFYRVDKARSRKMGGTGLGLSIVKHICLNNNIDIALDSKLGKGTTFTLTFTK